jgi:hypothetical protein
VEGIASNFYKKSYPNSSERKEAGKMEWIISIVSNILSLLLPQRQRRNFSLVVEETHPGEVKKVVVEYEDKHFPKPIK